MQTFKPWHPIEHAPEYLTGVFILQHFAGSMTVVCDADFGNMQLLVLRFEGFEAVATHEEFAHRWHGKTDAPELPKSPGSNWTFPFLQFENSAWAAESVQAVTFGRVPCHYVIVSGSDIVDILSLEPPELSWTPVEAVEFVMEAAASLGAV
ncbi:hypothetical protein IA54_021720 [Xanthomonas phaseoli pv. syngonii LMG 9055]|uniref:Uncharacterized protein n=1 Tax=Xanthomonas phaseoli pv. syngonii LMG 9055 TaxID=1437878 RepID=A0A1V9HCS6_9XANT|nr:hypothetical protein IA54_021720 [Xanthomonas phaseoli pv. syngonii LMG 9055]